MRPILKVSLSKEEDPTGQASNRASLNKKLKVRLAHAQNKVIELFNTIPRRAKIERNLSLNQDTFTTYDYEISPELQDQLESQIQSIVNFWLLMGNNQSKPFDFYADTNVEQGYRTGALEAVRDLNAELAQAVILGGIGGAIGGAIAALLLPRSFDVNTIIFSPSYIAGVLGYQNDMFYRLKGLSEKTSSQVYGRITDGMKANKTPREIIKDIKVRFGVSQSGAERIANTEINRLYNDSVMSTIDFINETTNINVAGRHISALLQPIGTRTRVTHAARHEKIYTTAQQMRWWETGTNRIRCYCSFFIVLLDKDNKPIISK